MHLRVHRAHCDTGTDERSLDGARHLSGVRAITMKAKRHCSDSTRTAPQKSEFTGFHYAARALRYCAGLNPSRLALNDQIPVFVIVEVNEGFPGDADACGFCGIGPGPID
jgi:hypothetical protein